MNEFNYDSYCGLYCGACSILKAFRTGVKDPLASFFSDEAGMTLQCRGCKSDQLFVNCAKCDIRPCAQAKGIEHCINCPDYPCVHFAPLEFLTEKLPHLSVIAANTQAIRDGGVDRWLDGQEAKWKCPDCGTDFTWYAAHCSSCGRPLEDIKPHRNAFDKSVFK
jgi:hypothetical protein